MIILMVRWGNTRVRSCQKSLRLGRQSTKQSTLSVIIIVIITIILIVMVILRSFPRKCSEMWIWQIWNHLIAIIRRFGLERCTEVDIFSFGRLSLLLLLWRWWCCWPHLISVIWWSTNKDLSACTYFFLGTTWFTYCWEWCKNITWITHHI